MRFERFHWHHYFGGVALILLILQLLSGIFLALYYQPHLDEAYASVQQFYLSWGSSIGAWLRDSHRWIAFFLFFSIVIHTVRSLLRQDFLKFEKRSRVIWLTGGLLMLPLGALLVTGFVLPWEWKGYWWMEIIPNYLGFIPYVGPSLKQLLIDSFSMNRNFVAHVVILPVISIVLVDLHIFSKVRKRQGGLPRYFLKHGLITIPFIILVCVLSVTIPMPTEDPNMVPMPLEGAYIPTPEWFFLIFLVPFMHFKNVVGPFLGLYLAFALYLGLTFLPYFFKRGQVKPEHHEPGGDVFFKEFRHLLGNILKLGFMRKLAGFLTVFVCVGALFGFLYSQSYRSPTLGCNSCHNIAMGQRMGVPPKAFKDRNIVPLNDDTQWLVEHWFYPQITW